MRIGFTGTQQGCTPQQLESLRRVLSFATEFHHGDCIGADAQARGLVPLGCRTVCHPPKNPSKRAWTQNDATLPEKEYLERNHDIVDACPDLVATPKGFEEEPRWSGTWATIRYARRAGTRVTIIWPDGNMSISPGAPVPLTLWEE